MEKGGWQESRFLAGEGCMWVSSGSAIPEEEEEAGFNPGISGTRRQALCGQRGVWICGREKKHRDTDLGVLGVGVVLEVSQK